MLQLKPDKAAFIEVCHQLENGEFLTCKHLVDVFGWPVVELLILLSSPSSSFEILNALSAIRNKIENDHNS